LIGPESEKLRELRCVPFSKYGWVLAGSVHQASVFWRRELYDRAGGMDLEFSRYATDHELFLRFIRAGGRFALNRNFLSSFRRHGDQTSDASHSAVHTFAWRAMRRELPILRIPGAYQILRAAMRLRKSLWHIRLGEVSYVFGRFTLRRAGPQEIRIRELD
jgi:GT2 family glycosyltransferase